MNVSFYKDSYLLSSIVQFLLRVFEHFLTPQVEEVIRVGVELQAVLAILPVVNNEHSNNFQIKLLKLT